MFTNCPDSVKMTVPLTWKSLMVTFELKQTWNEFKAADVSPCDVLAEWLHPSVCSESHSVSVPPVTPAPSSGAAHDTHAAAGHDPEHPDTHNTNYTEFRLVSLTH